MKKLFRVFLATMPMFLLLMAYNNCIMIKSPLGQSGQDQMGSTTVGNPMDGDAKSPYVTFRVLNKMCTLLSVCHPDLAYDSCRTGVLASQGMDDSLGLHPNTYPTYFDMTVAEQHGEISLNSTASVDSCLSGIAALDCQDTRVQQAYNNLSPNPYHNVSVLPAATMDCGSLFH